MPLAFLEFSDDVDPTGLATFVLACLTLAALILTRRALKQTREEIGLSRQEVEQAHRPVLVPVVDAVRPIKLPTGETSPAFPFVVGNHHFVPVENIGSGPALDTEMGLTLLGPDLPEAHEGEHTMRIPGIGVGHLTPLELPLAGATPREFDLRLTYLDVAGKHWVTTASWRVGMANRYEKLSIDAVAPAPAQESLARRFLNRLAFWS